MRTLDDTLRGWAGQAAHAVAGQTPQVHSEERGRVLSVVDGIATVSGLPGAQLNELLHFEGGAVGHVMGLAEHSLHCVVLQGVHSLAPGQAAQRTGDVLRVPVGPALLGRVVNPLGQPLDGGPAIDTPHWLPAERPAPTIIERDLVTTPVHTGTLAVDALFPLGRGQRELIIGDSGTGKTALALDALIAQRDSGLICVYVAVGQKSADTAAVIEAVRRHGAPERCIFVVASGSDSAGLQWLAPFAGFSMAEHFRDHGQHALVVVDDLSKHAAVHRELALLMHQPPGREAYPGDVFYLHARLLERAAMLSPERGGGSLTALPVAQTEAGNLSAYIPTNLISITDGQIVLDARLAHLGQWPAVDTGLSVSRVGGKTQTAALRQAVSSLRLEYAQFLELEMFTRFGTTLEARAQARVTRGRRIRAALAQPRLRPLPIALQLAVLLALRSGRFDALPEEALAPWRERVAAWLATPPGQAWAQDAPAGRLDATAALAALPPVEALAAPAAPAAPGRPGPAGAMAAPVAPAAAAA